MDEFLNNYLIEKHFPTDFSAQILSFDPELKQQVVVLFSELSPSFNSFNVLYDLAYEVSKKDNTKISDIFKNPEILSIISSDKGSRKDKLSKIRTTLEKLRYPEKFNILDHTRVLTKEIKSTYSVNLDLPEELEGDSIEVKFTIKSEKDLENKIQNLNSLLSSKKIDELFNLLLGRS